MLVSMIIPLVLCLLAVPTAILLRRAGLPKPTPDTPIAACALCGWPLGSSGEPAPMTRCRNCGTLPLTPRQEAFRCMSAVVACALCHCAAVVIWISSAEKEEPGWLFIGLFALCLPSVLSLVAAGIVAARPSPLFPTLAVCFLGGAPLLLVWMQINSVRAANPEGIGRILADIFSPLFYSTIPLVSLLLSSSAFTVLGFIAALIVMGRDPRRERH